MDVQSCDSHFSLFLSSVNLGVGKPIDVLFFFFFYLIDPFECTCKRLGYNTFLGIVQNIAFGSAISAFGHNDRKQQDKQH